jgi:hypothetical protein
MPPYVSQNQLRSPQSDPMSAAQYSTTNPQRPEDLSQPLYDRVEYPKAGTSQISFFSTQLGQSANLITAGATASKVKTRRDTNLDTSGVVPTKLYQFIGLSIVYIPLQQVYTTAATASIADDIMRLKYGGWLDFKIIDKPILQTPLALITESNPINALSTTVNAATMIGTGQSGFSPMYKFGIPITLNPFESFSIVMNFDGTVSLNQEVDILLILHAFMRRPT